MLSQVKIYVFGSCHFSERLASDDAIGNGGYGVVITKNGKRIEEISGGFSSTTNARMEILGIIEGIKKITEPSDIVVYSTNGYVIDTLSKGWLEAWKKNGYKKKKNVDLWKKLDVLLHAIPHSISFKHSRDVKSSAEFQNAESLGKKMSAKNDMPKDIQVESDANGLYPITISQPELLEVAVDKPILDAVCVDASCLDNPGKMEYRGVDIRTGQIIFEKTYEEATNNIGEFLAIVHAIAFYKKEGKELSVVYSDSLTAISWVKQKKCKTKLQPNYKNMLVFEHIQRAIVWLNNNEYNTKVLKWNTVEWGEIPADYGRK